MNLKSLRVSSGDPLHKNVIKLIVYSLIYGIIFINYIDLVPKEGILVNWYHFWLVIQYFVPFVLIALLYGYDEWELVAALGFLTSLMNDLLYAPIGMLFQCWHGEDLFHWYLWQLGFYGLDTKWTFQGGLFSFPVSSILMGLSIYIRSAIVFVLVRRWYYE